MIILCGIFYFQELSALSLNSAGSGEKFYRRGPRENPVTQCFFLCVTVVKIAGVMEQPKNLRPISFR